MSAKPRRGSASETVHLGPEGVTYVGLKLLEHLNIDLEDIEWPLRDDRHAATLAMEVGEVALEDCTVPQTIEQLRDGVRSMRLKRDSFAAWVGINLADQSGGHADVFVLREWLSREDERRRWRPRWSW